MSSMNKSKEGQGYLNICFKQSTLQLLIVCDIFQHFSSYLMKCDCLIKNVSIKIMTRGLFFLIQDCC